MKTILVATDYSKAASNALAYAAGIARQLQATLVLYNAFQLPPPMAVALLSEAQKNRYLSENTARLGQTARQLAQLYGITVRWQTSYAYLDEELPRQVVQTGADLVVMGMRSSSTSSSLMGNTAITLLRHAHYPVLLVPEEAYFTPLSRILFACDYHLLKAKTPLHLLEELAKAFGSRVQVLHVEKEEALLVGAHEGPVHTKALQLETVLHQLRHEYKYLEAPDVVAGIEQGIEEFDADLLVMVPRKAGFWSSMLHESTTANMAFHSRVPLLALPCTQQHHSLLDVFIK
ncbi:universal stress protein [Cesiribacter andamanensis]|nr:universal stress protein [Cesiribacter andamanensis]